MERAVLAKRDNRISLLRIICIILVVFAHSIIIYKNGWNLYNTEVQSSILDYVCQFIYLFHMPLFFAISGFLAGKTYRKTDNIKELVSNKAKRLLVPYILIGLLYLLPIRYLAGYSGYINEPLYKNICINILLGFDNGHLWFLASLFIIFIIHYLITKKVTNRKLRLLLVGLLFVAGFFIPTYVGSACKNILWFHLGYMLKEQGGKFAINKWLPFALFISLIIAYFLIPRSIGYIEYILQAINILISALAIITAFQIIPDKKPNKVGAVIEKNSMGVYLLHSPLIYFAFAYLPNIPPVAMLAINFVGFGTVSLVMAIVIRKCRLGILLGES